MTEAEIQEARVNAVARAMARAVGSDKSEFWRGEAAYFVAAFQALHEFEFRLQHGRAGPYGQKAIK